jgi:RNA polymerase sigma-70 factor (ECF subfamily)
MSIDPGPRLVPTCAENGVDALVSRVAHGDAGAFERLYDELGGQVYGVARRVVRDPSLAEDVTQEVFLDVWRGASGFDSTRGSARTWVMTIARRRAVDAVRRGEAQRKYDGHAVLDELEAEEPLTSVIRGEERAAVRLCLDSLTELQGESLRLTYLNGYTTTEVATLLHKPVGTIRTRIRDGLVRLRDCLECPR